MERSRSLMCGLHSKRKRCPNLHATEADLNGKLDAALATSTENSYSHRSNTGLAIVDNTVSPMARSKPIRYQELDFLTQ